MSNLQSLSRKVMDNEFLELVPDDPDVHDDAILRQPDAFLEDNEPISSQRFFDQSGPNTFVELATDQPGPNAFSGSISLGGSPATIPESGITNPCPSTETSRHAWCSTFTTTGPAMPETETFWLTAGTLDFEDQPDVFSDFPWTLPWSTQHAADHIDLHGPNRRQALPRRRSRYRFTQSDQRAAPIPISVPLPTEGLDPMQRWRESPPQDEPASIAAIRDALKQDPTCTEGNWNGASPKYARANSWGSIDSGGSSSSIQSASSVWSATSNASRGHCNSVNRTRQGKIAKNRPSTNQKNAKDIRPFKCTFCCDSFKTKYDWARHEKSRHLNPESWVCAPHGGSIFSTATGHFHCVYCSVANPSTEHLESHNHSVCHDRPIEARSFGRKDHLVQHLRVMHKLEKMPQFEDWKAEAMNISSRCGFCDRKLSTWNERSGHLADHFRKGASMKDWKGEHGFSPSVALQVVHALPPYLIGSESLSVVPFSVTSQNTRDHFDQISSRAQRIGKTKSAMSNKGTETVALQSASILHSRAATSKAFTEILEQHLKHFAEEHLSQGVDLTDEMLRQESRRVIYDCDDEWNQTVADNSVWLATFRRRHGFIDAVDDGKDISSLEAQ
ncbi:benzoate 4-monooxygenase cytochrome p450 [Colletotrichum incanum]|uniref:Benzoate 4-monooxygenase cytochrome p450 n=1 Tax=Colletotrichum incanum TaxID=1573173 RepID=A0A167C647_COLIC|nr:benzoate 4-monooxygenase cytochrome p450 [Colletotrichum incanum]OHW98990.1 hypothetical protein CSPAE12_02380 [Colletotrichum incanum]